MEVAARRFFASPAFAVVGASSDKSKFGYRIFAWYHVHGLPVIPINPARSTLSSPEETALSFLTPPQVTRKVLQEAKTAGVKSVWLQPGSFEEADLKFATENFDNAIGGYEDGTVGGEGWCVLVDGENAMRGAGRDAQKQKL